MAGIRKYHQAANLEEAVELCVGSAGRVVPVAGATSLGLRLRPRIKELVDLSRVGLDYIRISRTQARIGATATAESIARSRELRRLFSGVVCETASQIGSQLIRNQVTIGGNVVQVYAWSDFPVTLLALGARFKSVGGDAGTLKADDFFARHPTKLFPDRGLLKEVVVPIPGKPQGCAYSSFCRTSVDYALATVCVALTLENRAIGSARIAVGALRPLPFRLAFAEKRLRGETPSRTLLRDLQREAQARLEPTSDFRVSSQYKRELTSVLLARSIRRAFQRARKTLDRERRS